jgi:hypothetical protein
MAETFEFSYNSLGWLYPLVKTTANIAIAGFAGNAEGSYPSRRRRVNERAILCRIGRMKVVLICEMLRGWGVKLLTRGSSAIRGSVLAT